MTEKIPFEDSGFYSTLVLDYLHGSDRVLPFVQYPHTLIGLTDALKFRNYDDGFRLTLTDVLLEQYFESGIEFENDSSVLKNIQLLKQNDSFTVTTGHQLCLLSGPLYVVIKIAHAVKLSQQLNTPQKPVLPVFWMASEDHDIDEIKTVVINGKAYEWQTTADDVPVGKLSTDQIDTLIFSIINDNPALAQSLSELQKIYSEAENLSVATRHWAHRWFGNYGLIILDANDKKLKSAFKNMIIDDVIHQKVKALLDQTNSALKSIGYHIQVNGRTINHFYLKESKRILINKIGSGFELSDKSKAWTSEQLENEINNFPERFSPNVVMRPLYQETILPNIAYVGGPGELSYWIQLKGIFDYYNVSYPFLAARSSFIVADTRLVRMMRKIEVTWSDILKSNDHTKHRMLQKWLPTSQKQLHSDLKNAFQQLIDETNNIDNAITAKIVAHLKKEKEFFETITKELNRAKRLKLDHELKLFEEIIKKVKPQGVPQERLNNIFSFTTQPGQFIDMIFNQCDTLTTGVKVIHH